jgi:hypothetical protein
MYQDKIEQEAKSSVLPSQGKFDKSVFERTNLDPLTFIPEEAEHDATAIARDILIKRSNDEIIKVSKSIKYMLKLGEQLLHSLALKQLRAGQRICVTLSEGRSLYLLHHFFDIKTLSIKNLKWCEVFATLALTQSAIIKSISITEYSDDALSQALKASTPSTIQQLREEIIDCIARAECLFDTKVNSTAIATKGAKSKASNIEPLKFAVIELYMSLYSNLNNKRAGEAIFKHLTNENNKLLFLSYAEEKNLQFSKWVGEFLKGNLKLPIKK